MERFRFWCQKVLPLVYDDSLSYYELLCKVVDYLNNLAKTVNIMQDELTAINDYIQKNTEKVVLETLTKWLDDGTITSIFEQVVQGYVKQNSNVYSVFLDNRLVVKSVISDQAQGFTMDAGFFYMLHHASDTDPLKLAKISLDGALQSDKVIMLDGKPVPKIHGNSLNFYNEYLYAAFAGDDTLNTSILKINPLDGTATKIDTGCRVSAIDFFSVDGNDYAVSVWSNSQNFVEWYIKDDMMIPYSRPMQKQTTPLLKQGIKSTGTHVYLPYSGNGAYKFNSVRVYTHGLQNTVNIFFNNFNDVEMEDLGRIDGKEVMYWNDLHGNIYAFDTDGILTQSQDIVSFSNYSQALDHYFVAFGNTFNTPAYQKIHTSNSVSLLTEFIVPPNLRRTWSMTGTGYLNVLGGKDVPLVCTPSTGDIIVHTTSDVWNGSKYRPCCLQMRYKFDESNAKYKLSYFLLSCNDTPEYVYDASADTDAKLQVITAWIHSRFPSMTRLTDRGYFRFDTSLNYGATYPVSI